MYEKVFQLDSRPFVSTPDVVRFYSARVVHQALSKACSTVDRASGTVVVVGPTGCGKTLFLSMLEDQFRAAYRVVNLACARLAERQDLLQNILFELNQPYLNMSEGELRLALIDYLKPSMECPNGILLLVDEAHLLTPALFDEIRLLTNFVRDGRPRTQLVLAGNMKLEENLMDSNLESFNQRIAARCYLENFSASETEGYIFAAIARAGGLGNEIFTEDGVEAVYEVTEGCPRLINQVCDHAMILAASTRTTSLDAACIHEAWADVQHMPNSWAEVAAQSVQTQEENYCEVEFGSLEDGSEFQLESSEVESVELGQLTDKPLLCHEPAVEESVETLDDDTHWNEIEFGQLDQEESEQLASLAEYEQVSESVEVSYEIEQVIEHTSTVTFEVEQGEFSDEYQLAPPESVEETVPMIEDYPSLADSTEIEQATENRRDVDVDDYVDVRFRDLAQFLAGGGVLESNQIADEPISDEEVDPQDQVIIQDELNQVVEQDCAVVHSELIEDCVDEAALDAELNEIMQAATPEIKVFQVDEEVETVSDAPLQSWKDLFAEPFEQEELVHDPYTAMVVEQNTQALSLTRLELSVLEDIYELDSSVEAEQIEATDVEDETEVEAEETEQVGIEEPVDANEQVEIDEQVDHLEPDHLPASDSVDGQDLLDTIQKQQAEIADQIFKLKKDLAGTGVHVEGLDDQDHSTSQGFENPVFDANEAGLKLETPLESVDNDDRDILVITRVEQHQKPDGHSESDSLGVDTPVSKGRAIRMEYNQLFKQLRAAE